MDAMGDLLRYLRDWRKAIKRGKSPPLFVLMLRMKRPVYLEM